MINLILRTISGHPILFNDSPFCTSNTGFTKRHLRLFQRKNRIQQLKQLDSTLLRLRAAVWAKRIWSWLADVRRVMADVNIGQPNPPWSCYEPQTLMRFPGHGHSPAHYRGVRTPIIKAVIISVTVAGEPLSSNPFIIHSWVSSTLFVSSYSIFLTPILVLSNTVPRFSRSFSTKTGDISFLSIPCLVRWF